MGLKKKVVHMKNSGKSCQLSGTHFELIGRNLSGGVVVCLLDENYTTSYINDQFLAYLNYTYDEFMTVSHGQMLNMVHPEDKDRVIKFMRESLSSGESYTIEYRTWKKNGDVIWLRDTGKKTVNENGQPIVVSVCIDITDRVFLQKQLDIRNQENENLMNSLPCGICKVAIDDVFTIIYANEFFYGLLGYTTGEQARSGGIVNAKSFLHTADFTEVMEAIQHNLSQNKLQFELEHRFMHQSGRIFWGLVRCSYSTIEPDALTCVLFDISDRKEAEEQLRIHEEESRIAFELTDKIMAIYDIDTQTLIQAPKAIETFTLPRVVPNVPYGVVEKGIVAEESVADYIRFYESMREGIPRGSVVAKVRGDSGKYYWYSSKYALVYHKDGTPQRAVLSYEDVTKQRERELAYQKWSQYFEAQRAECIGFYEYNLTKDIYSGNAKGKIGPFPDDLRAFSSTVRYIAKHFVYEEDAEKYLVFLNRELLLANFYTGQTESHLEHRRRSADGSIHWVNVILQLFSDPYTEDIKTFILVKDIDVQKNEELKLQNLIEQDALTGILNRGAFIKKVEAVLQQNTFFLCHALIMLDVDNFKRINDTYGHQFGDQVLKDIALKLKNTLREGDLCGRLGGDEFVVLFYDIGNISFIKKRLQSMCESLVQTYHGGAKITTSIGVSHYPHDGIEFADLYHKADIALYEAKKMGRNRYVVYQAKINGIRIEKEK